MELNYSILNQIIMKYLKLVLCLTFFFYFQHYMTAQYADLLKDKNISWIAEVESNYSFEMMQTPRTELITWVYPVKIMDKNSRIFQNNISMDTTLFWQSFLDTICLLKKKEKYIDSILYTEDSVIRSCRCYLKYRSIDSTRAYDMKSNKRYINIVASKTTAYTIILTLKCAKYYIMILKRSNFIQGPLL